MPLKFQDPPPAKRGPHSGRTFYDEVQELVSRPNEWALLAVVKESDSVKTSANQRAHTMGNNIRAGKYRTFADVTESGRGKFEVTVRDVEVYVRFVPRDSEV